MIKALVWDSDFFKIKVGSLDINDTSDTVSLDELRQFDLIYINVGAHTNVEVDDWITRVGAKLMDEKTVFAKPVLSRIVDSENIQSYNRSTVKLDEEVINIGMQSGIYSRFSIDENFSREHYNDLYRIWMERSIDRTIAFDVLVYCKEDVPLGVLTLGEKNGNADIGILAVDEKHRGLKIGKKLVDAAEAIALERGYNTLQVVTQKANANACKFYSAQEFEIIVVNKIYHWWKK